MKDKIGILDIILQCVLIILSYIIPKNKNILLFGSGNGVGFRGNTKYLYLHAVKKVDYKVFWMTKNLGIYYSLKNNNLPVVYLYSLEGFISIIRSNFLFIETSAKDIYYIGEIFGNFKIINLWHGIPLKYIGDDMIHSNKGIGNSFKYKIREIFGKMLKSSSKVYKIISTSSFTKELFIRAFDNNNIFITGYPRNDVFFDTTLIQTDVKNKLNLENYSKIITYAPTFRDKNSISPFTKNFIQKLDNFCITNNYLFVLKLHPFDESLLFTFREFKNVIQLDKTIDLQELLVYTDILITDYSSVFFDFMITRKPIIYYSFDYDFYTKNCREMYFDYYTDIPGPFVQNEDEIIYLLQEVNNWFQSSTYQKKYQDFLDKIHTYKDGNSSQRVFDLIDKK